MVNKIRAYIDHEFAGVPESKKVNELKEGADRKSH